MCRKEASASTYGTVVALKDRGLDYPTVVVVQYMVNGKVYEVSETVKLKSKAIKIGFLPIGQKKTPVMGDISLGNTVRVNYNPLDPGKAYLPYNKGWQT